MIKVNNHVLLLEAPPYCLTAVLRPNDRLQAKRLGAAACGRDRPCWRHQANPGSLCLQRLLPGLLCSVERHQKLWEGRHIISSRKSTLYPLKKKKTSLLFLTLQ